MHHDPTQWIQLASGRAFWPLDPDPADITIEDIAHGLSLMNRYGGHTRIPFSVAQHSVLVSLHVPPGYELCGLLHDASEGLGLPDLPRPVKRALPDFQEAEARLMRCVAAKFGFPWPMSPVVKQADLEALATERRDLMGTPPIPWKSTENVVPWPRRISPLSARNAERLFLRRYRAIVEGKR